MEWQTGRVSLAATHRHLVLLQSRMLLRAGLQVFRAAHQTLLLVLLVLHVALLLISIRTLLSKVVSDDRRRLVAISATELVSSCDPSTALNLQVGAEERLASDWIHSLAFSVLLCDASVLGETLRLLRVVAQTQSRHGSVASLLLLYCLRKRALIVGNRRAAHGLSSTGPTLPLRLLQLGLRFHTGHPCASGLTAFRWPCTASSTQGQVCWHCG